jgi:glycopeptide antibiotics resistance protein
MIFRFLIIVLILTVIWSFFRRRSNRKNKVREFILNFFFIYLLGVIFVTFEPFLFYFPDAKPLDAHLVPFEEIREQFNRNSAIAWYYLIANIVMLIPFGLFLPYIFNLKPLLIMVSLSGFAFSLTIETFQLLFTFRSFDVDDLIFNTTGALIGGLCYGMVQMILMGRKKREPKFISYK